MSKRISHPLDFSSPVRAAPMSQSNGGSGSSAMVGAAGGRGSLIATLFVSLACASIIVGDCASVSPVMGDPGALARIGAGDAGGGGVPESAVRIAAPGDCGAVD